MVDWQSNPSDLSKGTYYYKVMEAKVYMLDWLLRHYLNIANYTAAEFLLLEENTPSARQELLGMKASRSDWSGMATMLGNYPVNNQEDAWFVQIQQINLQRLSATLPFTLSASQESLLYQVALSASPIRGFARGLIAMLKGERIVDGDPEDEIQMSEERSSKIFQSQFNLFPNPANGVVTIEYPNTIASAGIELIDMFGQRVFTQRLDDSGNFTFSSATLPMGIYSLKLEADGILLFVTKLVVTH